MRMTFFRHAEIAGDAFVCPARPVSGCLSAPRGLGQAHTAAERFKGVQFDIALASPYGRALQTCEAVLDGRDIPVKILPCLREWLPNPVLETLPSTQFEEIQRACSNLYAEETWKTELGEGCYDLYARVVPPFLEALAKLGIHARLGGYVLEAQAQELSIAVFAHGGSLNILLAHFLELRPFPVARFQFELAAAATLRFEERHGVFYPQLLIS